MNAPMNSSHDRASGTREPTWNCEEIERLYQQALVAVEAVATDLNSARQTLAADEADEANTTTNDSQADNAAFAAPNAAGPSDGHSAQLIATDGNSRASAAQVIESLLFVGGQPLTANAMSAVLRGEYEIDFIEQTVAQINRDYSRQNRPYAIRLADGGYRIILRTEFESIRNRVYGYGPKQVRLSQETLEILALVAYRQPISRHAIEETGKRNAGSHLRQLLARELLVLDRSDAQKASDVKYRTSDRFLQLFGISRLEELPQIEDFEFK
jgi:segregation and condensation protein B